MKSSAHWSSTMLWIIYLALLAVLLPHTAWAFARFESPTAAWQDRLGHTRAQQTVGIFKMKRPGEGTNELAFAKTVIRLFIDAP